MNNNMDVGSGSSGWIVEDNPWTEENKTARLEEEFASLVGQGSIAMAGAHGYQRADSMGGVMLSAQDEMQLHRMILERWYAKRLKNFEAADRIRNQLRDVGVFIDDHRQTYTIAMKRELTQHDYVRSDDASVFVTPEDQVKLDALLLERMKAKMNRNFEVADRIRNQLKENNIFVDDSKKTYTIRKSALPTVHDYTRGDDLTAAVTLEDLAKIDALILQRTLAKFSRDYVTADSIRDQLRENNVYVDDKKKEYYIRTPKQPPAVPTAHDYTRGDDLKAVLAPENQSKVDALLLQRMIAKMSRDYPTADSIRDQLRAISVYVDDKKKEYYVRGPKQLPSDHGYTRTPQDDGTALSSGDQAKIDALLLQRVHAKIQRDYDAADSIRNQLREANVFIDEKKRTYRVRTMPTSHDYVRKDDSMAAISAHDQLEIDRMLLRRMVAKMKRDYEVADSMRKELLKMYVYVNDREKTYRYSPPKQWSRSVEDTSGVVLSADDEAMLISKLALRQAARRERNYEVADSIRDELEAVAASCGCTISIDDKNLTFLFWFREQSLSPGTPPPRSPGERERLIAKPPSSLRKAERLIAKPPSTPVSEDGKRLLARPPSSSKSIGEGRLLARRPSSGKRKGRLIAKPPPARSRSRSRSPGIPFNDDDDAKWIDNIFEKASSELEKDF